MPKKNHSKKKAENLDHLIISSPPFLCPAASYFCLPAIVGVWQLDFCVRDGNRYFLPAFATVLFWIFQKQTPVSTLTSSSQCYFFSFRHNLRLSFRPISTGQLHASLHFHLQPISLSSSRGLIYRRSYLGAGFALRCFQRLSIPCLAARLCFWRNNRSTIGRSIPVLSY